MSALDALVFVVLREVLHEVVTPSRFMPSGGVRAQEVGAREPQRRPCTSSVLSPASFDFAHSSIASCAFTNRRSSGVDRSGNRQTSSDVELAMTDEPSLRWRIPLASTLAWLLAVLAGEVAWSLRGSPFVASALVGALALTFAGVGLRRRSLQVQIASRGALFVGCTPLLVRFLSGNAPTNMDLVAAMLASGALLLSRPMLETEASRAEFAPARFRRTFLAGMTTATAAAIAALAFAAAGVMTGFWLAVAFNTGLAIVLLLAVRGLLMMRTWGLLLGAAASLVLLALAPFYGAVNAVTLGLAAMPALLLWTMPLLLARRRAPRVDLEPMIRSRIAEPTFDTPVRDTVHAGESERGNRAVQACTLVTLRRVVSPRDTDVVVQTAFNPDSTPERAQRSPRGSPLRVEPEHHRRTARPGR